jgi:hypothetical protein
MFVESFEKVAITQKDATKFITKFKAKALNMKPTDAVSDYKAELKRIHIPKNLLAKHNGKKHLARKEILNREVDITHPIMQDYVNMKELES